MSPAAPDAQARRREALRQQLLLRALWRDHTVAAMQGWLREAPADAMRGLQAYAAAGGANTERALAQSHPTVQALVGEETFALLARAYRLAHPPSRGDLSTLGERFADFIAADPQLADVPYLADCARLDGLLAQAERAGDLPARPESFALLQQVDPAGVRLELAPGTAVMRSAWPVATVRAAHDEEAAHTAGDERFAAARAALAAGRGECIWVWRQGFKARAAAVTPAEATLGETLIAGQSLGAALERAGAELDFESWLLQALRLGWLLGARLF